MSQLLSNDELKAKIGASQERQLVKWLNENRIRWWKDCNGEAIAMSGCVDGALAYERESITDLYRYYDADGNLLYVGISISAIGRAAQHKLQAAWWHDAVRIEIEKHPNREAAMQAEVQAIRSECPLHNRTHSEQGH